MEDVAIKLIWYAMLALLVSICLYLVVLSFLSRNTVAGGVHDGTLKPCPDTPNCVVSNAAPGSKGFIEPLPVANGYLSSWQRAKAAITDLGGEIVTEQGNYLHARFSSRIFRFIDDVELLLDTQHQVIQVRSASRAGRSDFGVNRKRVERLRKRYTEEK